MAAVLLKRKGHDVVAIHMTNWSHEEEGINPCEGRRDEDIARAVCDKLKIEFRQISFDREFWQLVFEDFLNGLRIGKTPNPDVLCNFHIKFSLFLRHCLDVQKCDLLATGHYAKFKHGHLLRGADHNIDQVQIARNVNAHFFQGADWIARRRTSWHRSRSAVSNAFCSQWGT